MFSLHMLPAGHGDCICIEYGDEQSPRRVLIDGGAPYSFKAWSQRLAGLPGGELHFELFVITHVDADHIGGALELLRNLDGFHKKIVFGDVWFNAWKHLLPDALGDLQGELVTDHLTRRDLPWNKAFGDKAVVVSATGSLPAWTLPGGLRLTLLSPTREQLDRLRARWKETITRGEKILGHVKDKEKYFKSPADALGDDLPDVDGLAEKEFTPDRTVANGSSIALLAEYGEGDAERRCLLTGDAHVGVLSDSLRRLMAEDGRRTTDNRLVVDAMKLPHHGSKNNVSKELLDLLYCPRFLFSTNGQQFKHPSPEGVARVIKYGRAKGEAARKLFFNYKTPVNKVWAEPGLLYKYEYQVEYPREGEAGLQIDL